MFDLWQRSTFGQQNAMWEDNVCDFAVCACNPSRSMSGIKLYHAHSNYYPPLIRVTAHTHADKTVALSCTIIYFIDVNWFCIVDPYYAGILCTFTLYYVVYVRVRCSCVQNLIFSFVTLLTLYTTEFAERKVILNNLSFLVFEWSAQNKNILRRDKEYVQLQFPAILCITFVAAASTRGTATTTQTGTGSFCISCDSTQQRRKFRIKNKLPMYKKKYCH